jgi:hypothetical protein
LEQEYDASEKQEFEAMKQKTLNLLWSIPKTEALAAVLGNGEMGRRLAEVITAIQDDLPVPEAKKEEGGRRRGRARSKGSARSKTERGGQTESNPIKAEEGNGEQTEGTGIELPVAEEGGGMAPGQGQSNPVKPEVGGD